MPDNIDKVNGETHPGAMTTTNSPSDLESSMIKQFDDLVAKGEIMWAPYTSEPVEDRGFKAVLQLAPHLLHKPIQPDDAPERKTGKGKNPFLNPDPAFVVARVEPSHTLLLNKYCVYRPSLILHTNHFAPQSNDLDTEDLTAAWNVLTRLLPSKTSDNSTSKYLLIYNCGIQAGSSQGHKHMQIWPYPSPTEIGFDLFPSHAQTPPSQIADNIPNVPHRHFVTKFPERPDLQHVIDAYAASLRRVRDCHAEHGSTAYNVALTSEWLCLIPRRDCGISRGAGSNAAGVLGLVWVSYEEEKDVWLDPSLGDYIRFLGVPRDDF